MPSFNAYTKAFGIAPAHTEIVMALEVTPPSVNNMLKMLEKKQLIARKPGVARAIELLLDPELIPAWEGRLPQSTTANVAASMKSRQWKLISTSLMENFVMDRKKQQAAKQKQAKARQLKARKKRLDAKNKILQHYQPNEPAFSSKIYRFKISLRDFEPAIWRRIEIPDVTLEDLHHLIQSAMGWENCHLHDFKIGGQSFVPSDVLERGLGFDDMKSYDNVTISSLVQEHGEKLSFLYDYDYGDGWSHNIKLEKLINEAEPDKHYPRCVDGENACPPEDIGGVWGYADFLEAINDPDDPQHDEMIEWHDQFDPTEFNPKTVSANSGA